MNQLDYLWDHCGGTNLELNPTVHDGAGYYVTESGMPSSVTSELPFAAGQSGMLALHVEHSTGAYENSPVIPAPAGVRAAAAGWDGLEMWLENREAFVLSEQLKYADRDLARGVVPIRETAIRT